jgi:hypothetical protein
MYSCPKCISKAWLRVALSGSVSLEKENGKAGCVVERCAVSSKRHDEEYFTWEGEAKYFHWKFSVLHDTETLEASLAKFFDDFSPSPAVAAANHSRHSALPQYVCFVFLDAGCLLPSSYQPSA